MTSVAEERARNTLETLLTAPVTDWQVILSKWMGTFFFYVVMLLPTLVYLAILAHFGRDIGKPDAGPVMAAYVGALLLGAMYIAIGLFASSVTENALLSAFVAFFVILGLWIFAGLPQIRDSGPEWIRLAARYASHETHFNEFLKGRIALHDVGYFVSTTVFFLFLAVRAIESRKWR
jgi:ABC-2 type transport system permease protein